MLEVPIGDRTQNQCCHQKYGNSGDDEVFVGALRRLTDGGGHGTGSWHLGKRDRVNRDWDLISI
jgi:hypothetical protein